MQAISYDALAIDRLGEFIKQWGAASIAVAGDFFLDRYLIIDPTLSEASIETGLDAYQVVEKRPQPGAAGTVTSNLHALRPGDIIAVGISGDDGEGWELRSMMEDQRLNMEHFMILPELMTPTYTKPLVREADGMLRELNRLDIRNRVPITPMAEEMLIERIKYVLESSDAVIISDQETEAELGVVTPRVFDAVAKTTEENELTVVWADSRGDISRFRGCIIKPNAFEACRAAGVEFDDEPTVEQAREAGERLLEQTNSKGVVVTLGADGVLVITPDCQPMHVPGVPVEGEIDTVGAGDSFTAGMVATLSIMGTGWSEAAIVGNLTASITIQQIGTTGTATPEQLLQRLEDVQAGRMPGAS